MTKLKGCVIGLPRYGNRLGLTCNVKRNFINVLEHSKHFVSAFISKNKY